MTVLGGYALLYTDLGQAISGRLGEILGPRPASGSPLAIWTAHMNQLNAEIGRLLTIATNIANLDAQGVLASVHQELATVQADTITAEQAVEEIAEINQALDLLGKFVTLGFDIYKFASDPVDGIGGVAKDVSGIVDVIGGHRQESPSTDC